MAEGLSDAELRETVKEMRDTLELGYGDIAQVVPRRRDWVRSVCAGTEHEAAESEKTES